MKFQLAINMERVNPGIEMDEVAHHTLEMVQMADAGGFDIVWAAVSYTHLTLPTKA